MRGIRMGSPLAAVVSMAVMGLSPASAANWDPQGTVNAFHGNLTLTTNAAGSVSCTVTGFVKAGGSLANTTTSSGNLAPPVFTNCTNNIASGSTTAVVATSSWGAFATSTTAVDVLGQAHITISQFGTVLCRISVSAAVANNSWSNAAHTLTANSASSFPVTESGACDGGTTGTMAGVVGFPASMIIT